MSENVSTSSRAEYLARIRRFTDEMLDRLNEASGEEMWMTRRLERYGTSC